MVDFKKLLGRTPEQREVALEVTQSALLREIQEQISSRAQMVERLSRNGHLLNENARVFVATLARKAQRTSTGGLVGGELADLSAAQASYLEGLHDKVAGQQGQPERASSPASQCMRSERYGSRSA